MSKIRKRYTKAEKLEIVKQSLDEDIRVTDLANLHFCLYLHINSLLLDLLQRLEHRLHHHYQIVRLPWHVVHPQIKWNDV